MHEGGHFSILSIFPALRQVESCHSKAFPISLKSTPHPTLLHSYTINYSKEERLSCARKVLYHDTHQLFQV